jgi:hypothetical protein
MLRCVGEGNSDLNLTYLVVGRWSSGCAKVGSKRGLDFWKCGRNFSAASWAAAGPWSPMGHARAIPCRQVGPAPPSFPPRLPTSAQQTGVAFQRFPSQCCIGELTHSTQQHQVIKQNHCHILLRSQTDESAIIYVSTKPSPLGQVTAGKKTTCTSLLPHCPRPAERTGRQWQN